MEKEIKWAIIQGKEYYGIVVLLEIINNKNTYGFYPGFLITNKDNVLERFDIYFDEFTNAFPDLELNKDELIEDFNKNVYNKLDFNALP